MRTIGIFFLLSLLVVPVVSTAQSTASFFDVFPDLQTFSGPPYPTTAHHCAVGKLDLSGVDHTQVGWADIAIQNAIDAGSGLAAQASMTAGDSGGPLGQWAVDSFFDIFYPAAADTNSGPTFFVDSFFDVAFSYDPPGGGGGTLVALHPSFPSTDVRRFFDVYFVDSFFDITYEVEFDPGEKHIFTLHGAVPPEALFTNVQVQLAGAQSTDSFFDIYVEVSVNAPIAQGAPLVAITQTGVIDLGTVPAENTTWGSVKSLYEK